MTDHRPAPEPTGTSREGSAPRPHPDDPTTHQEPGPGPDPSPRAEQPGGDHEAWRPERPHLRLLPDEPDDDDAGEAEIVALPVTPPTIRLPRPLTGFVGRGGEVKAVAALLRRDDVRLLTLLGVGGVGKTRLAIAAAQAAASSFAGGVVFVALAAIADPALVLATISQSLGLPPVVNQSQLAQLRGALQAKRMLVVLDNFEHVAAAGPAVLELVSACSDLTVLVTSRVQLRLSGEQTYRVQPLVVPEPVRPGRADRFPITTDLSQVESVQLFVERARAARADLELSHEQLPAIGAICTRLDGLPLAIELAAARCSVLTPAGMLARLDQRLPLLGDGPRDQPDRLRTMRSAIAWSYDLLTPAEQAIFRRLSVFAGGFTLEAAGAMLPASPDGTHARANPGDRAFAAVEGLVGQSLLVDVNLAVPAQGWQMAAGPRFTMLETVREFGQEKLVEHGEEHAAHAAHAAHFLTFVDDGDDATAAAPEARIDRLEADRDNLRAALAWVIDQRDTSAALRLAAALGPVWQARGPYAEGRAWLERALALGDGPVQPRLSAMTSLSHLLCYQGKYPRAEAVAVETVALARQHGDPASLAGGLVAVGQTVGRTGELPRAVACFEEALAIFRELGDATGEADVLNHLGIAAWEQGDVERFGTLTEEALAIWQRLAHPIGIIESLDRLSLAARMQGNLRRQAALASEIISLTRRIEDPIVIASTLWTAAAIMGERNQATLSARFFGAQEALRDSMGIILDPVFVADYNATVSEVRAALGEARFTSTWAAGRTLDPARALTEAKAAMELLAGSTTTTSEVTAIAVYGLTPREREVLRLLVTGYSDKEIAATLFVSRLTASKHVSAILGKLGADSRTAATAVAYRDGLV